MITLLIYFYFQLTFEFIDSIYILLKNMKLKTPEIFLLILAFFVPPAAVGIKKGLSKDLLLSILLTLLGDIPGMCYDNQRDHSRNIYSNYWEG